MRLSSCRERLEMEPRWREKGEAEAERQRTRERLEATLAGLGELEYLRQRQELLVKALLGAGSRELPSEAPPPRPGDAQRSLEEKFLEENILLLRRQLNCLRKRDAGLLSQLHELDKQISDLKIDAEKTPDEHLETDSRPSSGFYELSDGASGSLSNSSNSVFSECLSSCYSSTCFCSPLEASLNVADSRPKSADDLLGWIDYKDQLEENASGTVRRSFSAPYSSSLDMIADVHPKYQCDLVSKNGSDVYRYPSPLHAVAVQSPMFLLSLMGNLKEEGGLGCNANDTCMEPERDSVKAESAFPPASSSGSATGSSLNKKLDGYILSILQKKTQAVRTNKPRTSVNADPTKGILRHSSMCVRQTASPSNNHNLKNLKQACLHSSAPTALDNAALSSLKQRSKDSQSEQLEARRMHTPPGYPPSSVNELQSKNLSKNGVKSVSPGLSWCPATVDPQKETSLASSAAAKESPYRHTASQTETKVPQPAQRTLLKSTIKSPCQGPLEERPPLDFKSEGSSSPSLDEGMLVNAQYIPAQQQTVKHHKGTKHIKTVKSAVKHRAQVVHMVESSSQTARERSKVTGKKCRFPDDLEANKKWKKPAPRGKRAINPPAESGLSGSRHPGASRAAHRLHGHGKEGVVAKPKYKRGDYRRWKSSVEISYEEALRRAKRRGPREPLCVYAPVPLSCARPYAYVASDSEYSAECESLFHSTVVETSEDEQSNYTTNCFGDSESSLSEAEYVGESTSSSDSDESGGLIWSQFVHTLPVQSAAATDLHASTAKAFVKIKASHNLKKKILRFRSGSLKLMTTV
ncbi:dapper homolog 1 [Rhinatrema bivittatum]|uniref:dapper homolog 1 n=1 Tax=Rhinatrema bivittatum TaxID=194408 RepID=UPI00112DDB38|nr:dapper homolog 1 [Rhinatrema bivittatum]